MFRPNRYAAYIMRPVGIRRVRKILSFFRAVVVEGIRRAPKFWQDGGVLNFKTQNDLRCRSAWITKRRRSERHEHLDFSIPSDRNDHAMPIDGWRPEGNFPRLPAAVEKLEGQWGQERTRPQGIYATFIQNDDASHKPFQLFPQHSYPRFQCRELPLPRR